MHKEETEKRSKEADPIEQNRMMGTAQDTHTQTNRDKATWRYIKLEAISSKPVAGGNAKQN